MTTAPIALSSRLDSLGWTGWLLYSLLETNIELALTWASLAIAIYLYHSSYKRKMGHDFTPRFRFILYGLKVFLIACAVSRALSVALVFYDVAGVQTVVTQIASKTGIAMAILSLVFRKSIVSRVTHDERNREHAKALKAEVKRIESRPASSLDSVSRLTDLVNQLKS